ncbi:MAG: YXWGXW repeat-containing protein, partial [Candidatus Cybelea sp.]
PPPIPVYTIPVAPEPNYMYTPGYWAWGAGGYYWVPGVWVAAPAVGAYWTPGYWGSYGGAYRWNAGYWGPRVGFYGGINYGFGYFGTGFVGGTWAGGGFRYNTAVWPVNRTYIHNTYYDKTVINNYYNHSRVSYNGGHGGISARPTNAERSAYAARRYGPTPEQVTHARYAGQDRTTYAKVNNGHPPVTTTTHVYNDSNHPAHYGTTVTHYNGTTVTHYNGTMNAQSHPAGHAPAPVSHPSSDDQGHKPPKH